MANSDRGEDLSELLGTLPRKKLAELLCSATNSSPSTRAQVLGAVDEDPSHRHLYITGGEAVLTEDSLRSIFSPFGEIEGVHVPVDGQSRHYGFVLFCHLSSAKKALKQPGMPVACSHTRSARTIRVKNLPPHFNGFRQLTEFFEQFGEIEDVDHIRFLIGQPRADVSFVYKTLEGAVRAFEEPTKIFDGIDIVCEREDLGHLILPGSASSAPPPLPPPAHDSGGHQGGPL